MALGGVKKLFLVTLVARPREHTHAFREFSGAYVNAWIDAPSKDQALDRAQREVSDSGWTVETVESVAAVQRTDYQEGDPALEYFDQALTDREVVVFHTWPVNPQEDDLVH
jgi:hypothetical protein